MLTSLPEWAPLLSAFLMGLFGGAHCIGMCGGVMAALSFSIPAGEERRRLAILLFYNFGRIVSYVLIGTIAGFIGYQFSGGHGLSVLRIVAGLLLVAMGLYLANWWRGLVYLERIGGILWRLLQPLSQRLMPVRSVPAALLLGALWGWLPCGLVYTAVAFALAQASAGGAALVMLAFGLGTLPAVLAAGVFAERLQRMLQARSLRVLMAMCIILFGIWTLAGSLGLNGHSSHQMTAPVLVDDAVDPHEGMDHSHHH